MNKHIHTLLAIGLIAATTQFLPAQVKQVPIRAAEISWPSKSPRIEIRSGGELIAAMKILKAGRLRIDGDTRGIEVFQTGKKIHTYKGAVEITTDGKAPWRISGEDIELNIVEE